MPNADQAVKRVAQRVKQGGHHIPEEVIKRRYSRGLVNLVNLYLPLMDTAIILNNSDNDKRAKSVIAEKDPSAGLQIHDQTTWLQILKVAHG